MMRPNQTWKRLKSKSGPVVVRAARNFRLARESKRRRGDDRRMTHLPNVLDCVSMIARSPSGGTIGGHDNAKVSSIMSITAADLCRVFLVGMSKLVVQSGWHRCAQPICPTMSRHLPRQRGALDT